MGLGGAATGGPVYVVHGVDGLDEFGRAVGDVAGVTVVDELVARRSNDTGVVLAW
jgi:hypothetical protein